MSFFKRLLTLGRDDVYDKAMEYFNSRRYPDAIELFKEIIERKKSFRSLYFNLARFYCGQSYRNLGIMLFATGNFSSALESFQHARQYNDQHVDVFHFIGICQNNLGEFDEAVETFNTILKIDPSHIPTKLKLGIALHNLKMWDKAATLYSCILDKHPGYADVQFRLGLALTGQGKTEEALEAFRKAVAINPNYVEARKKLAIMQAYLGRLDDAYGNFSAIAERCPDYPDILYYLGLIHACRNEIDQALDMFSRALAINPNYRDARIKRGILYCLKERYEEGLEELTCAKAAEDADENLDMAIDTVRNILDAPIPERHIMRRALGQVFSGEKSLEQTVNEFFRHIEINPDVATLLPIIKSFSEEDTSLCSMLIPYIQEYVGQHPDYPDLHNTLGTLYLLINRLEDAAVEFREAVRINPDYLEARISLFKTLNRQGFYDQALEQGRFVLEKNVPYPDVYCVMAESAFALDRPDEALRYAKKSIELNARFGQAYYVLACIYERRGDAASAREAFEHCLALNPPENLLQRVRAALEGLKQ